jgi:hypothetical protein
MGLQFFDVNGETIKTGSRTVKCATGYNLAGLLVGAEGTLGVFDRITLTLIPQPAAQRAMTAVFDQADRASETVAAIIASHIVPATLEFMDNFTIQAVEEFSHAGLPVDTAALLLIEVDGHPAQVQEDAARAQALAGRTMDISQLVVQRVNPAAVPVHSVNGRVVTFHDSCHLKKSFGVFSEPRDLIRANPDYTPTEMPAADDCCGMGGSFNLEHYGLSARIGRLKRDNIATTGCAVVATGCPACLLQISDMLSQAGDRIAVKHPVEI